MFSAFASADMDFARGDGTQHFASPRGASFWPMLPSDEQPEIPFPDRLAVEFEDLIEAGKHKSKKLLTQSRRADYREWLEHPTERSEPKETQEERQQEANARHYCLKHFELDGRQVYRRAGAEKGYHYGRRYAACTWDAANLVVLMHVKLHHASRSAACLHICTADDCTEVEKTYEACSEVFYGISKKDVRFILSQCAQCKLSARSKGKPAIQPIISSCVLERLVIDLIDMRSTADGDYKWILQMKDHFSRYVFAYALKDKSADTVGKILEEWFLQNGYPKYWCVILLSLIPSLQHSS